MSEALVEWLPVPQLGLILLLIALNLALSVLAALRLGTFEWRSLAEFYRTRVVPYLGGFIVLFATGHAVELYFANGPLAPLVDMLESIFVDYGGPLYIIGSLLPRITDALSTIFAPEERRA